eukprot:jgi/Mesvir1/1858/Mv16416-RA.1
MQMRPCVLTLQGLMAIPGVGAQLMDRLPLLDRVRLRLVCRSFLSAADESLSAATAVFGDDVAGPTCRPGGQGLSWLLTKCPNLTALSVASRADHEAPWRDRDASSLSWHLGVFNKVASGTLSLEEIGPRYRGSLRYLNVAGCWDVTSAGIIALASSCSFLEALDVSFCAVDDAAIRAVVTGCRHLSRLSVAKCPCVSDASITFLSEECRGRLTWVDVGDTRVTAAGIIVLAIHGGANLCHLALDGCAVTDECLSAIGRHCPSLRHLGLRRCAGGGVSLEGVRQLGLGCPQLDHMDLAQCSWVADLGIRLLAESWPHLTHLDLAATSATDAGVAAVAQNCWRLEHLDVAGCTGGGITDASIIAVARGCPRLRHLAVSGCDDVTDAGICAVARHCPGLTELKVAGCGVTDASMLAIADNCAQLTRLDVSGCCPNVGKGLGMVVRGCPWLDSLNVSDCEGVTEGSIYEVGEHCKWLRVLHACGSSQSISEHALMPLLKHVGGQLRVLHLSRTGLSDRSVRMIAHCCPRLHELAVAGCPRVTDGSVRTLVRQCRELQFLDVAGCPGVTRDSLRWLHRSKFRVDAEEEYDFAGGVEYAGGGAGGSSEEDDEPFDGMEED